ncbi:MAG: adenine deaminase [Candidatus Methanomethylicota archaeon]|uniref:Adenine deaminase n=2 Tax=Thermoproteota archaeon TaxID=2056631 RepID=A0A497F044_9CREN|nr:MAG: adenine deaminase [Candidatus Verstraetearchaeota archaeon]
MTLPSGIPGRSKLHEILDELILTATGKAKADLVIQNGILVNVYTGEIIEKIDIAIKRDRIALIGDAAQTIGPQTKVIDASGKFIVPGLLDGHIHIESTMLTLTEFAKVILPKGTTGVFIDSHEIANVLGVKGVKLMADEARSLPLKVFICIPSCVPATSPEFETSGAEITTKEVEEMLKWEEVVGLAEVMNYPGVIRREEQVLSKIRATIKAGKVVEGHAPKLHGAELCAYAASGVSSCHESTSKDEGIEKLRVGMTLMIREGSAWKDLAEVIKAITEEKLNSRRAVLVSDDRHPEDLITEGHVDHLVRRAIQEGVDPVTAIQMATINVAEHYNLDLHIGGVAPPRYADMLIVDGLEKFKVSKVIADGKLIAENGKLTVNIPKFKYPNYAKNTIKLKKKISPEDFKIKARAHEKVNVRVIVVKEESALTKQAIEELKVENGEVKPNLERDIVKISVVERHKATGNISIGFVKGFNLKRGAAASSVAHDSHNIIVVGASEEDMATAVNKLVEIGGGMIVVLNRRILAMVELPIAGLMSNENAEKVSEKVRSLDAAWRKLGCKMRSPFMTMSILALPVIPELRITDKGLVDVKEFKIVDVLVED